MASEAGSLPTRRIRRFAILLIAVATLAAVTVACYGRRIALFVLFGREPDYVALAQREEKMVEAIFRFRQVRGRYPRSLGELVPDFLPAAEYKVRSYESFGDGDGKGSFYLVYPTRYLRNSIIFTPEEGWVLRDEEGRRRKLIIPKSVLGPERQRGPDQKPNLPSAAPKTPVEPEPEGGPE